MSHLRRLPLLLPFSLAAKVKNAVESSDMRPCHNGGPDKYLLQILNIRFLKDYHDARQRSYYLLRMSKVIRWSIKFC